MNPEDLTDKDWFATDDLLRVPADYDPDWDEVCWTTTADYIAYGQVQMAVEDPDVVVCDIEASDDRPEIYLRVDEESGDQDFPSLMARRLVTTAGERFRQHDLDGQWQDKSPWEMLFQAGKNAGNARFAIETGDDLAAEEQMADALNYMVFALTLIEEDG